MRKRLPIEKINNLPKAPGVYFLKNKAGNVFYIGKSNNMQSRVRTHANAKNSFKFLEKIHTVEWVETANEIEALIKESEYIKRYQPKLNSRLRDDKQYSYVGITREDLPRVFITHQPVANAPVQGLKFKTKNIKREAEYIGPFTDAGALKATMRYLRKLFPYYQTNAKRPLSSQKHRSIPCSWCHIGQCPGPPSSDGFNKKQYRRDITTIKQILTGKKSSAIKKLQRDMAAASSERDYEKAAHIRDTLTSVENIFSHHNIVIPWTPEKLKREPRKNQDASEYLKKIIRSDAPINNIEGYDISNIQGKEPTASMVRFDNGAPNKSLYRKFNIQAPDTPNDYLMIREVIRRRFGHKEWSYPDLILIDGGRGQLNAARYALGKLGLRIPVASLAKRLEELYIPARRNPLPTEDMPADVRNLLKHIRDEAHRFAISHHRKRHRKIFR